MSSADMIDEHGEWTVLNPSYAEDTSVSFCLVPGEFEIWGSEGDCYGGWGGGYMRVFDLMGKELLGDFTMTETDGCSTTVPLTVNEDVSLTESRSSVLFERNRATGTSGGFCGLGCGGALYIGESCAAELDRIDLILNSAADGGALFVDALADLSLARGNVRDNAASRNGGAVSVGTLAVATITESTARRNSADASGGMAYLSGVAAATLRSVELVNNNAGTTGGALAAVSSSRTAAKIVDSTVGQNTAAGNGGGLFLLDSEADVVGTQLLGNTAGKRNDGGSADEGASADDGAASANGGGVAMSGSSTNLGLSDTECVNVDVLLDWTTAGDGCPTLGGIFTALTAEYMITYSGLDCATAQLTLDKNPEDVGDAATVNGCSCNDP